MNAALFKGVGLMTLSWACFAAVAALIKYTHQYTTTEICFFSQNFVGFLFVSCLFLRPGFSLFKSTRWPLLISRSLIGGFSFYTFFLSLSYIPLTDGMLLNTSAPLFVPLLLQLWLKKKSPRKVWVSCLIGFCGVLLILKPSAEIFQVGAIPALLSGIGAAMVMLIVRQMIGEDPRRIILIYLLVASLCALPFAAPSFSSIPFAAWPWLLLIGILFGSAQIAYTRSLSYAEASLLAPFTYSSIFVATCIDWFVWDRVPTFFSIVGMVLIIFGGVCTILWSHSKRIPQATNAG